MELPGAAAEDFSGVPASAGPAGEAARRHFMLRLAVALGVAGLFAAVSDVAVVVYGQTLGEGMISTVVPAALLLMAGWAASLVGLGLVIAGHRGPAPAGRIGAWALWLNISLFASMALLTVVVGWFVLLPVALMAFAFSMI